MAGSAVAIIFSMKAAHEPSITAAVTEPPARVSMVARHAVYSERLIAAAAEQRPWATGPVRRTISTSTMAAKTWPTAPSPSHCVAPARTRSGVALRLGSCVCIQSSTSTSIASSPTTAA